MAFPHRQKPTPFGKRYKKAYAPVLLRIAEGDLETAKGLVAHPAGRIENTFFFIEQATEKAIKAAFVHFEIAVPMSSDLSALLAMIPESLPRPPFEKEIVGLTEFATVRRYEEGYETILPENLKQTVKAAAATLEWAKKIIK